MRQKNSRVISVTLFKSHVLEKKDWKGGLQQARNIALPFVRSRHVQLGAVGINRFSGQQAGFANSSHTSVSYLPQSIFQRFFSALAGYTVVVFQPYPNPSYDLPYVVYISFRNMFVDNACY